MEALSFWIFVLLCACILLVVLLLIRVAQLQSQVNLLQNFIGSTVTFEEMAEYFRSIGKVPRRKNNNTYFKTTTNNNTSSTIWEEDAEENEDEECGAAHEIQIPPSSFQSFSK